MLLDAIIAAHVATGFIGLAAFWVPVFARKGGAAHVRAGRVYAYCAYVVTLSAVTASLGRIVSYQAHGVGFAERPDLYGLALFLGYLGVTTFALVRHALRAVATRKAPETFRTSFHALLAWACIAGSVAVVAVALGAWSGVSPVLLGLSPVGALTGLGMLREMRAPAPPIGWFYSHMGAMLGGGVAFHTAFAVFGSQRLWTYDMSGPLNVLPWILPTLVGAPAIALWTRHYRRRFAPARQEPAGNG